jgi:hypothetical protein
MAATQRLAENLSVRFYPNTKVRAKSSKPFTLYNSFSIPHINVDNHFGTEMILVPKESGVRELLLELAQGLRRLFRIKNTLNSLSDFNTGLQHH